MTRPKYRVPTMAEIAAVEPCGLTWVETFAGCGGSSLGARMAGFKVLWANEFVPIALESYRANAAPHTVVDGRDVKTVRGRDILAAAKTAVGEIDVFSGSPPCQPFSSSGRREKGWRTEREYEHGAKQRNEDLFFEYVRLRDELMPRAFVAENVSGLVKGAAKGYFLEILAKLKKGYRVMAPLLDAQWLGVPQARQRIVFVGVRDDLGVDPPVPAPLPRRFSLKEALDGLDPAAEPECDISRYAVGAEYDRLSPGQQSDKYFNLVRPDPSLPCPTVMSSSGNYASAASVVHPWEKRKFSVAELRRICGFPDDFVLAGDYGQRYERLGNSVPPPMMFEVAKALRDKVLLSRSRAAPAPGTNKATRSERTIRRAGSHAGKATATSPARGSRRRG